jgi:hypothetical protein
MRTKALRVGDDQPWPQMSAPAIRFFAANELGGIAMQNTSPRGVLYTPSEPASSRQENTAAAQLRGLLQVLQSSNEGCYEASRLLPPGKRHRGAWRPNFYYFYI